MNRKIILLATAMAVFADVLGAQTMRPYDEAVSRNLWLMGSNVAGLREEMSSNVSYAELYGGAEAGTLRRSYEASSLWNAGADARTVKHLDRFSMIGGFSFEQNVGKDMCGSMFIHPGRYPVDALEFTPGQKTLQTYSFDGGISIDLSESFRIGASLDFESANYSKRKDIRHTNYALDLTFSPGVSYTTPSGDLTLGLNYIYRKNSESCEAEQIGTGESTYFAFLDKGLYYGKYEAWSGSGVHLNEAGVQGLPLKEDYHGFGLQMCSNDNFYCDVEFLQGRGIAGEKEFVWFRFPTREVNVHIGEIIEKPGRTSYFREIITYRHQENNETVLDKVTENGVSTIREYGSNLILNRDETELRLEYEFVRKEFGYLASASLNTLETRVSQMYPFVSESALNTFNFGIAPYWHRGAFDLGFGTEFSFGLYDEIERSVSEESGVVSSLFRLQDYYELWKAYETSAKVGVTPFVRLNLKRGIYIQTDGFLLKAFNDAVGSQRYGASLCLGWDF